MSRVGGAPPFKTYFIGRASSGRDQILRLKLTPSCSLALCSAWKSRASLKLGLLQKLAAITSGRVLKIEPTPRQISEETLESLKLRERNFKHRTTPSSQTNRGASPRVTQRHDTRGFQHPGNERQISVIST